MYLSKTPFWASWVFPKAVWKVKTVEPTIYLTFDDGPTPDITHWVLEQLAAYQAKATFFVIGKNVAQHPDIFHQILQAGHQAGNHTYHHVNGWNSTTEKYLQNIQQVNDLPQWKNAKTDLFRPPYGKMKWQQYQQLKNNYNIVMWDVLSGDFDTALSGEDCFERCKKAIAPGSIIVFHDSVKAFPRLKICLPLLLQYYSKQGYCFEKL